MEIKCPNCGVQQYVKAGKTPQGKQRYKCRDCQLRFTSASSTIFHSQKLERTTMRELLAAIIRDLTVEDMVELLGISIRTAYMWRIKVYKCLENYQENVILRNNVWIDEFFIPVNRRDLIMNKGKKLRGVSVNQIVIAVAIDSNYNRYAELVGKGHITSKQCLDSYGKHIEKGSHLIHDGTFSHDKLIKELELTDEIWKPIIKDAKRAMQPINSFCAQIERNFVKHIGGLSANIQDYLNWIVFKNSIKGLPMKQKINRLEAVCLKSGVTYKVKDRY